MGYESRWLRVFFDTNWQVTDKPKKGSSINVLQPGGNKGTYLNSRTTQFIVILV